MSERPYLDRLADTVAHAINAAMCGEHGQRNARAALDELVALARRTDDPDVTARAAVIAAEAERDVSDQAASTWASLLAEEQIARHAAEARVAELEREMATQAAFHRLRLDREIDAAVAAKARAGELQRTVEDSEARVAELTEALSVARDLLAGEGYDTDPDYTQEWATVSGPLAGDGGGA